MKIIYLSPHLDDAVFSCGGLIWEQTQGGHHVEIWTIFSSDPPTGELSSLAKSLHEDWNLSGNPTSIRRQEDFNACQILGATPKYFSYRDCIYRQSPLGEYFYQSEVDIFGGMNPQESDLIDLIGKDLLNQMPPDVEIAAPLGIGNHVDHEITRKAVSRSGITARYYADYPYLREPDGQEVLSFMAGSRDWKMQSHPITETGIKKWYQAAQAYSSQIPVFWESGEALLTEIRDMEGKYGGIVLWTSLDED